MEIIPRIYRYTNSQKYQHLLSIPQKSVGISDTSMSCCWCWWNPIIFSPSTWLSTVGCYGSGSIHKQMMCMFYGRFLFWKLPSPLFDIVVFPGGLVVVVPPGGRRPKKGRKRSSPPGGTTTTRPTGGKSTYPRGDVTYPRGDIKKPQ